MKVTHVEAIPIAYPEPNDDNSTRHLLIVRLTADDGQIGWGEAVTMWPEASLGTKALVEGLAPIVLGRSPLDRRAIWTDIKRHTWWYGEGGLASFALAALDIALWDLAGKATNSSVLDLLGGPVHPTLPALISCHANLSDHDAMTDQMAQWVSSANAVGIKVALGKRGAAGLGTDLKRDLHFLRLLRQKLGPQPQIMIDVAATLNWSVRDAITRTQAFEESDISWIEEPLGADNPVGYAELRSRTRTHIAYGEREWTVAGIRRIVATGTVDVVGIDPGRCEGITGFIAAAEHIRGTGRQVNAHAWSSAIVTAASVALSLATDCCKQIEIKPLPSPPQHELVTAPIEQIDGLIHPPTNPGLGITVNEEALERYRYTSR